MIRTLFSLIVVLTLTPIFSQKGIAQIKTKQTAFEKEWKEIDSLLDIGLPRSALDLTHSVLKKASRKKDRPNEIKARLILLKIDESYEETSIHTLVQYLDSITEVSQIPERAIWNSIHAQYLHQYYQRNRWTLLNQTRISGDPGPDPETWDAWVLLNKISTLYQRSIANDAILKKIPLENYSSLLIEGKNTRHLRPTLYDLLAFRAIEFFQNEEKNLNKPAYHFQIDDPHWFSPAEELEQIILKTDSSFTDDLHFLTLKVFQDLLQFHLSTQNIEALIDVDIKRLEFVHRYATHPKKDSLYLDALKNIEVQHPDKQGTAKAIYQRLDFAFQLLNNYPGSVKPMTNPAKDLEVPQSLLEIKEQLDRLINKFPDTEGKSDAISLSNTIMKKQLNISSEEVVLPDEHSKALITYKNLDTVYFRLYPMTQENRWQLIANRNDTTWRKHLSNTNYVKKWSQSLPASEDLDVHTAEFPIPPLSTGAYLLVASAREDFGMDQNIITTVQFQVSSISVLRNSNIDHDWILGLHRKSGMPLIGAEVQFWSSVWNSSTRQYEQILFQTTYTDEEGKARYLAKEENRQISSSTILIQHGDTLFTNITLNGRASHPSSNTIDTSRRTILYSDRAIYRPGQSVFFKGIVLESIANGKSNQVIPGENMVVHLRNHQRQIVDSIKVTTNDYGSFSGNFVIPQNILTGTLSISTDNSSIIINVEEYKRPRFKVEFDKIEADISLGENVFITGRAEAFAGNRISGAQVKYRITRNSRYPYPWVRSRFILPHSAQINIAEGEILTDDNGKFNICFEAIPDKQIPPESQPIFLYTIHTDVTDINGETQSSSTTVNIGYHSLSLQLFAGEWVDPTKNNTLRISTLDLNQEKQDSKVEIKVMPLQFPGKLYKNRLWEKPEQFILSEKEFRTLFPDDEYRDEGDYKNWTEKEAIWHTSLNTADSSVIQLPKEIWQQEGWHLIEATGYDKQGHLVVDKKYTYVLLNKQDSQPQIPLLVYAKENSLSVGDELDIRLKIGFKNAYVLESNTMISPSFQVFSDQKNIKKLITEEDKGGIGYNWMFVHNNRIYQSSEYIQIPFPERDLEIQWASHRDKLQPAEEETWTFMIKSNDQEAIEAEMLANLFDASLDQIQPHNWYRNTLTPSNRLQSYWISGQGFSSTYSILRMNNIPNAISTKPYYKFYDELFHLNSSSISNSVVRRSAKVSDGAFLEMAVTLEAEPTILQEVTVSNKVLDFEGVLPDDIQEANIGIEVPVRQNLEETAFFLPYLKSDDQGEVTFSFTMPEALTSWRLMTFAHTKDWKTGYLEGNILTQKELMVFPNMPRFIRQGDRVILGSKISNISTKDLQGSAQLILLDAETLQPVTEQLASSLTLQSFSVQKEGDTSIQWEIKIPENYLRPVIVRITAKAGNFTDGEDNFLPILTNRTLVTETLPLPIKGNGTNTFTFENLANNHSPSLEHNNLMVEFTSNPAWYAVQALPFLSESTVENTETIFNKIYGQAIANRILTTNPNIEVVFRQWLSQDSSAILSPLEKNQEIKNRLLETTPWVRDARTEKEQKENIAMLFDKENITLNLEKQLQKLIEMQSPDGGFPWFKGMKSNRYITQYITTGLLRIQNMGLGIENSDQMNQTISQAIAYLDRQIFQDYEMLMERKADLHKQQIGPTQVQYLYMKSLSNITDESALQAYTFYMDQAKTYWSKFNPYMKGFIALALASDDEKTVNENKTIQSILASLKESSTTNPEIGTYWKSMTGGYNWYEAPIEAQALLIETFDKLAPSDPIIDNLKIWLIKQKQTQKWHTTKATADAIHSLILTGNNLLAQNPQVSIQLASHQIDTKNNNVEQEAGTGFFQHKFDQEQINADMGNILVSVQGANPESISWGAVYWQYFEDLNEISESEKGPLQIDQELFVQQNTSSGIVLEKINPGASFKVGDKVVLRTVIRTDRNMEFVHINQMWAACFEPTNSLSGFKYKNGLGYYESIRDQGADLFIDYLGKGTYVIETSVFVNQEGTFSNGISRIQSAYAPEFGGHTKGIQIKVQN